MLSFEKKTNGILGMKTIFRTSYFYVIFVENDYYLKIISLKSS